MLLLYRYFSCSSSSRGSSLHSTMLLLYLSTSVVDRADSNLYIPLCFYYIPGSFYASISIVLPLHSTMLLLYQTEMFHQADDTYYFTFHYASTISWTGRTAISGNITFTFHYASTISKSSAHLIAIISNFTFHYASTISNGIWKSYPALPALHSTMLLLYLCLQSLADSLCSLYIPLCFYYILLAKET